MPEKKTDETEEQAKIFGVLADPTRLKLLKLLAGQHEPEAICVNAIAFRLGVTQPAISQHLRILKTAGLVKGERRGYRIHYFIDREGINRCREMAEATLDLDNTVSD